MDNSFAMQVIQSQSDLGYVELCFVYLEDLFDAEKRHEIATDHVLHHEIDVLLALQRIK